MTKPAIETRHFFSSNPPLLMAGFQNTPAQTLVYFKIKIIGYFTSNPPFSALIGVFHLEMVVFTSKWRFSY